jgi:hypothetical protein
VLAAYWSAGGPCQQRAFLDAVVRLADGQPAEDCFTEMYVELGHEPTVARRRCEAH